MKILIAGDWHSELHEEAVAQSLDRLGHATVRFAWHSYFHAPKNSRCKRLIALWRRFQNKYIWGGQVTRLNEDLIELALDTKPDVLFLYRGTHILKKTLQRLRVALPNLLLIGYNNDDPFSDDHHWLLWRHFIAGLPCLDLALAYRHSNIQDFLRAGAPRAELLRSWYIPERNYPASPTSAEREAFACDVIFIGHYEPDMRLMCLEEVVRRGWRLRIFGPGHEWRQALASSPLLRDLGPIRALWGKDYNAALCSAKVALCFFSKLNRDTYTRRCFEIPASGACMLSEYSDDLATMFSPNVDALYFRTPQELGEVLDTYLSNDALREGIASSGRQRVQADKHDVDSRMQMVLNWIEELRNEHVA